MNSYIIDIEAVPQSREILESKMSEELRNPVMPESIANPPQPDFSDGCPAYASIKDENARQDKRNAWVAAKAEKWGASILEARKKWELSIVEGKARFVEKAALDARLGHAKLIGMKDVERGVCTVYVWEQDADQMRRIRTWWRDTEFPEFELKIKPFMRESEMLKHFFVDFEEAMNPTSATRTTEETEERLFAKPNQCVTYYGNSFDFPFLYRRCWMLGIPQVPLFRRGRYWDDRMVDLHDIWQLGNREEKTGGLDNVAAALGYDRAKLHDGASFHKFYQEDPTEGITYLLNDLLMEEFIARRIGVIR